MTIKKHIIAYYPSFERGGITNNLINFLNECSKLNIQNSIITEKLKWKKKLSIIKKKTKLHTLVNKNYLFLPKRVSSSLFSSLFLIKILTSYKKKELVLISFQSHIIPIIICKFLGIKIIIRNSEEIFGATKYSENIFFSFLILILKILFYNFSDGIIANSSESKKSLNKIVFDSKKIKLIFNPYLNKIINVKKKKKNILLSIGRLCKQKDYPTLLKGFELFLRSNKNYKLIILGHGPDLKQLKKLALELKINKHIEFKGWVSNTKNYLKRAKIFVLPSLYEGSPNSLIDAVNFEIPTISTKCSGAEDILTSKNGNFFSFQNHHELFKKIYEIDKDYKKKFIEDKKF